MRFLKNKKALSALAVIAVAGAGAFAAYAFFTSSGTGSSTLTVSTLPGAGSWLVTNVTGNASLLSPGGAANPVDATIKNNGTSGDQGIQQVVVSILGDSKDGTHGPGTCNIDNFALGGGVWSLSNNNDTATVNNTNDALLPLVVTQGSSVTLAGNVASGLTVQMVETNVSQNECAGASVLLGVSVT